MGDTKSKPEVESQQETDTPKINHQKFANRRIIKGENTEEVIKIKVTVPSEKQFLNWKQQLNQIDHDESLLLPTSYEFKKEGFCGTAGTVDITYENYPFLLSDEIKNRNTLQVKYFQENQLWYLVYTLLSAANYFHRKGKKIGDVRPDNIFISEDGSVKTACISSWPMERTNYEKNIDKQSTYLAPEELSDLGYGRIEPISDFELAETFSIGLTVLDAATLTDSRNLYKNHHSFNYEGLATSLQLLNSKEYSQVFKMLVNNMCEANAEKRTKSVALYQWLNPFDSAINNFEEFSPKKLPQKFNAESRDEPVAFPVQIPMTNSNVYKYSSAPMNLAYKQPNSVFQQIPSISKVPYPSINVPKMPGSYIKGPDQGFPTFNPVTLQNYTSNPQTTLSPLPIQTVESTYVPYNSKFSLDRIEQQLQQSRKLFPV